MENIKKLFEKIKEIWASKNVIWKKAFINWKVPEKEDSIFSINSFSLCKGEKKDIKKISIEIVEELKKTFPFFLFQYIDNGYINVYLSNEYYFFFLTKKFFKSKKKEKKKGRINIEFVSANSTGYLHLANIRQAFFGDSLARIYDFCNYNVTREFYFNDRGKQVEELFDSVCFYYNRKEPIVEKNEKEISYPGRSSIEAASFLIKKEKQEKRILSNEEKKDEILNFIKKKIKKDLIKCGVFFDKWTSEKELINNSKKKIIENIEDWKKKELVYEKDSCVYFKSTIKDDDKDRVMIKSNGEYTYFLSDIFYHQDKFERAENLVIILGCDHHGYLKRLTNACCLLLNKKEEQIKTVCLETIFFLLEDGIKKKFSKRSGNTIDLKEALKYIDLDRLKFFCLEKDYRREIVINEKILSEKKEKSLSYYLQYANARCKKIIKNFNFKKKPNNIDLLDFSEKKILNVLMQFSFILEEIIETNKVHTLVYYLLSVAKEWQKYYEKNRIITNNYELSSQRVLLVKKIKEILSNGLNLLGLKSPFNM